MWRRDRSDAGSSPGVPYGMDTKVGGPRRAGEGAFDRTHPLPAAEKGAAKAVA
ncbi:hypothetical protein GCM10009864_69640 [Streptomyces lunalinharesii]|uniref:Uncharacterized protein n=1 Tax=Streptomyces lunalinharesii TaxID=333384 RepID=A0ABN3SVG8_9ACTN